MAHELDHMADGRAAMFSVRETPWHREGVVLSEAPRTVGEALAYAGLDWDVELRPACFRLPSGDYAESPDHSLVIRTDRERALGAVGRSYKAVQNRDGFRILEPLIDAGLASWETAGALRGGRDVWGLIRFRAETPLLEEVFGGEGIVPFGMITNNHAGSAAVRLMETPVRVVCANTLGAALGLMGAPGARGIPIRHTAGVNVRLTEAAEALWGDVIHRFEGCARQYRALRGTFLDEALFARLVLDAALPFPAIPETGSASRRRRAETNRVKVEERRSRVRILWEDGTGHTGDRSAWEAYNAVVEAVDHEPMTFPTRTEERAGALLLGTLADVKARVLDNLVRYALAV